MVLMPLMRIEGEESRLPLDELICTPATTPSRALVTSEDCTLAMSDSPTTAADPVKESLVEVPKATTIVS